MLNLSITLTNSLAILMMRCYIRFATYFFTLFFCSKDALGIHVIIMAMKYLLNSTYNKITPKRSLNKLMFL